jgi:hypothetical protein
VLLIALASAVDDCKTGDTAVHGCTTCEADLVTKCSACITDAEIDTEANTCTCPSTKPIYGTEACLSECPAGKYEDDNHDCADCSVITDCVACQKPAGATAPVCTSCGSSKVVGIDGQCAASCTAEVQYVENGVCKKCEDKIQHCAKCQIDDQGVVTCNTCAEGYKGNNCADCDKDNGYGILDGVCKNCVSENKKLGTDGTCVANCNKGEYEDAGVCKKCGSNKCEECHSADVCDKCIDGYKNSTEANMCDTCDEKYVKVGTECQPCNRDDQYIVNNVCKSCGESMGKYNETSEQCDCLVGFGRNEAGVCVTCSTDRNYVEDGDCYVCPEHSKAKEQKCQCDEGYKVDNKTCAVDDTYVVCGKEGGEQFPFALPDKCYKGVEGIDLPELEDQYWKIKHENGDYKICNYTEADCKGDSLCRDIEEIINGTDYESWKCEGGKCTGGYTNFPKCDVEDSSIMNMIVVALICIAVML